MFAVESPYAGRTVLQFIFSKSLKGAQDLVSAVCIGKVYTKLSMDKTMIPEYCLDAELEQNMHDSGSSKS